MADTVRRESGRLMDCAAIAREYGVSKHVADNWMRQLPKVDQTGPKKVWVWRHDLEKFLREKTRAA